MSKIVEIFKWFFDTQFIKRKSSIWKDLFMNLIALVLIVIYGFQLINGITVNSEFMILLSMILGYYFNSKHHDKNDID